MEDFNNVRERLEFYIKAYAKENGLKLSYIADQLGYRPKKFSDMLNGRATIRIEDLENICNYFGVSATLFIPLGICDQRATVFPEL